jgi:ubiquinone/menaquinone biosynthesis C-methylase UbiE
VGRAFSGLAEVGPVIMDQLGPVGAAMIERLDIADDQQHLDIAAGTGEPGLTVAKLAPRGHAVLTGGSSPLTR